MASAAETPEVAIDYKSEGGEDQISEASADNLQSIEAILTGDPIWCPASVSIPKPEVNGCTISYDSLALLFAELALAPKTTDGVIWIAQDYESVAAATLDGDPSGPLSPMRNFKLTFKGGWVGCGDSPPTSCSGVIQTQFPSELNHPLVILNWNNDITISDIWIVDSLSTETALQIQTTGRIVLTRVEVRNNAGAGARLDNTEGTKDILVTVGKFNNNQGGAGLEVLSGGAITLSNVMANGNDGDGVSLNNTGALSAKNVTLNSGLFQFNGNSGSGLDIESKGSITIKDITAVGNDVNGARLDNTSSTNALGITLAGTNIFSENDNHGLLVLSKGAIKANNLVNNANGEYGAWLDNTGAASAQAITHTGRSEFKFNGGGLKVESNGAISLANVVATNNSLYEGVNLNNSGSTVGSLVTLTGTNSFTYNRLEGLVVTSKGVITISNLTASFNGQGAVIDRGSGARLNNSNATSIKAVTLTGTNSFIGNEETGLHVLSRGAISLAGLTASENGAGGADLNNLASLASAPQNVTISAAAMFHDNGGDGLHIETYGAITLNGVSTTGNGGLGAELNNSTGTLKRDIAFKGANNFSDNSSGISVISLGTISINQLTALLNDGAGAFLSNDFLGFTGSVNLTGITVLSNNGDNGLSIETRGGIKIGRLTAESNQGVGVSLEGEGAGSITVGVSATNWCNSLSNNRNSGLVIVSKGPVVLNSLCNSGNGLSSNLGFGAEISNSGAQTLQPVTLNGTNSFLNNYSGGIKIISKGAIKANNLDASNNTHGSGASFDNLASTVGLPQNVTLSGVNKFSVNYADGLTIQTYGAITLNRITASSNGYGVEGYGAYLDNQTGSITPKAITLFGANSFSDNTLDGLRALSLGTITIGSVTANTNEENGAYLDNNAGGAFGGIAITTGAELNVNGANGLDAFSLGKISIANLKAVFNDGHGALLNNSSASPAQSVALSGVNTFDQNDLFGLHVFSRGAITVSNLHAWNNDEWGVTLDNSVAGAAGSVTVSGKQDIGGNGKVGLEIYSNRAVTISNLSSGYNGDEGAYLNNTTAGIPQNITLTGACIFKSNDLHGLRIQTLGAVTLSNITAVGNGFDVDTE
ncbi:MAG: beta strand repeat-containing protein, partial [Blastocatellia bacterium]